MFFQLFDHLFCNQLLVKIPFGLLLFSFVFTLFILTFRQLYLSIVTINFVCGITLWVNFVYRNSGLIREREVA